MTKDIPEKDILVAVKLIEKLTVARDTQSTTRKDFESISERHNEYKRAKEARTSYIDVLEEVAEAVGEDIEPENDKEFAELTDKLEESRKCLDLASEDVRHFKDLAEKLKTQAPSLWDAALEKHGKHIDLDDDTDYAEIRSTKNRYEVETDVEVVDQILNWKGETTQTVAPTVIEDGFDRSSFFNLGILETPRLQNRSEHPPFIIVDAIDVIGRIGRYDPEIAGGIDISYKRFITDLDFLSGHLETAIVPVFDLPYEAQQKTVNSVTVKSAKLKAPDKAALNRQILRIIEEELLQKKVVALVSDDLSLTRDAQLIGAIIIDVDDLYKGV